MRSESEFKAYWEGAFVWSDHELTDEQKTARCRAWFGLEFQCRHAFRGDHNCVMCLTHDQECAATFYNEPMTICRDYSQMPCNLLEIIKAQSLQSQAIITPEPKESCSDKATVDPEGIGECDHEDG